MNTRHVQTFLMVSAAFFAMNVPVRVTRDDTLVAAVAHTAQFAETVTGANEVQLTFGDQRP
jgi:hypothetical protein